MSEQNLIDCSTAEGNDGCEGGVASQAFKYIAKQGGIETEAFYSYEARVCTKITTTKKILAGALKLKMNV